MQNRLLTGSGLLIAAALFFAINLIANGTLTSLRLDLTENRLHTLSEGTRNILAGIDEPVTVRYFYSAKQLADVAALQNYGKRVLDLLTEYEAASGGKLRLKVIDPEPFSEAEDQAVGFGIEQVPLSATGEMAYLGLVGTNTLDDELAIPFLSPDREDSLEYDVTKMIYNLAEPRKRVIGLLSTLPVTGGGVNPMTGQPGQDWAAIGMLRELYEIREIDEEAASIGDDVDTLLVIHPKSLDRKTLYAIDQFILHGGRALIFVDPLAEADEVQPDPSAPMVMPDTSSNLPELFARWGLSMDPSKIATDPAAAVRVSFRKPDGGPQEVDYLPWLGLNENFLDRDDFITNQLNVINIGAAGVLVHAADAATEFTPLIQLATPTTGTIERDAVFFVRDPAALLNGFEPDGKARVIAARIRGVVDTAFPEGRPLDETETRAPPDEGFIARSEAPINVVVVADTDVLTDRFWVRFQNFLGMQIPSPFADNADFLVNSVDNLGGNDDLISLRSRGRYSRPFERVQEIRREAEARFRDQEQALQAKLQETEGKLAELQQRQEGSDLMLTPEQRNEIDLFRREQVKTRKELRAVQHELQKNIEQLGVVLKAVNTALVPALVLLFAGAVYAVRASGARGRAARKTSST